MIKQIIGLALILFVFLSGCVQETTTDKDIQDIEDGSSELDSLEQDLDTADIDDFEKGLNDIEGW